MLPSPAQTMKVDPWLMVTDAGPRATVGRGVRRRGPRSGTAGTRPGSGGGSGSTGRATLLMSPRRHRTAPAPRVDPKPAPRSEREADDPAVAGDRLAGDVARRRGHQEGGRAGELLGRPVPAERGLRRDRRLDLLDGDVRGFGAACRQRSGAVGADVAGEQRVDPDLRAELDRQR